MWCCSFSRESMKNNQWSGVGQGPQQLSKILWTHKTDNFRMNKLWTYPAGKLLLDIALARLDEWSQIGFGGLQPKGMECFPNTNDKQHKTNIWPSYQEIPAMLGWEPILMELWGKSNVRPDLKYDCGRCRFLIAFPKRGYSETDIENIMSNKFYTFSKKVWNIT